jgi:hypothetical protein
MPVERLDDEKAQLYFPSVSFCVYIIEKNETTLKIKTNYPYQLTSKKSNSIQLQQPNNPPIFINLNLE